jgi:hypothetical protein
VKEPLTWNVALTPAGRDKPFQPCGVWWGDFSDGEAKLVALAPADLGLINEDSLLGIG